jgi:hypothetical protein
MNNTFAPSAELTAKAAEIRKTLTQNEAAFIAMTLNYDKLECQLSDNYSNAGAKEAARFLFNGSKKAAGGLISSLIQKGIGYVDEDYGDTLWLTELGVYVAFSK